jgi:hypothetical protein
MKKIVLILILGALISPVFASGDFSLLAGYTETMGDMNYHPGYMLANNMPDSGKGTAIIFQGAYWYYTWWGIGGKTTYSMFDSKDPGAQTKTSANFFTFSAGIPLLFDFDPFAAGIEAYAGYGYVWIKTAYNITQATINASSGGLVFDLDAKFAFYLCPSFSIDIKAGYRFAANAGPVDMSCKTISAGLNYRFSSKYWPWYDNRGCCK